MASRIRSSRLLPDARRNRRKTGDSGAFFEPGKPYLGAALKPDCFTVPLLAPGALNGAIPTSSDTFETGFTSGQRNIFRQPFQKRADMSIVKSTNFTERYALKYTFDIYNLTNTDQLRHPDGNEVTQNENFNNFPTAGQPLYNAPVWLGVVTHTIGSPRQIQMSLDLQPSSHSSSASSIRESPGRFRGLSFFARGDPTRLVAHCT